MLLVLNGGLGLDQTVVLVLTKTTIQDMDQDQDQALQEQDQEQVICSYIELPRSKLHKTGDLQVGN